MALQDRYDAALSIIREHNEAMGPLEGDNKPPGYIHPDVFLQNVKFAGGTSEDRLKGMSYEDILGCMPDGLTHIKPVAVAKDIAKAFRGKEEVPGADKGYVSAKRVERMQPRELIDAFDPEEPDNAVGKRLREGARGEPFIVYQDGGLRTIDAAATLSLYLEVKKGYDGRKTYQAAPGDVRPVYRVGDLPDDLVDENPLYRNRPLRPDGTCDQTGRSWEGVPTPVRQLVRLVIESGTSELNIDRANDLIDLAIDRDGRTKLVDRYQVAALRFNELERSGGLPRLKMPLKATAGRTGVLPPGRRVSLRD